MSLTKSEKSKSEKNLYTLKFSVDGETFAKAVSDAFRKKAKNLTIPGFRRGKAPRTVIEKMYGKGFFYEDAFNAVLPAAWEEAPTTSSARARDSFRCRIQATARNAPWCSTRVRRSAYGMRTTVR